MVKKPLLTIGMIFKNEIRCLERCLKALQPLRDAIPCELVMADTGSEDGSWEIAERYADFVFDFPWINDFSAARNAVVDCASGKWFLTVDCDEYLDEDVSELTEFLLSNGRNGTADAGLVVQRNYSTLEMDGSYSDFNALRLMRLSTGARYHGSIHESWETADPAKAISTATLGKTVLHHDGYAGLNAERGKAKRERNLDLLRGELEKTPNSLRRLFQYVETGIETQLDALDKLRRALELVERKAPQWERYGPPLYRYAVYAALHRELPELETWAKRGEELFPESYFIRIDMQSLMFAYAWNTKKDYEEAIRWGEAYLQACAEYEAVPVHTEWQTSTVAKASPPDQQAMRVFLSRGYTREGHPEQALRMLETVDCAVLDEEMPGVLAEALYEVHSKSVLDTAPLTEKLWAELNRPLPNEERAKERRERFLVRGSAAFSEEYRRKEREDAAFSRPAYTVFLPLADECEVGRAAAVLETDDPVLLEEELSNVENWEAFPFPALTHALERGAAFPLPGKPLKLEEMDSLAMRLAAEPEKLTRLAQAAETDTPQRLCWARALLMAAVRSFNWAEDASDEGRGAALVRKFAEAEKAFLPLCYAPEVLTGENLSLLPSMHRFGWYCVRAFDALGAGDKAGYVRLLREGLESCAEAKPIVEFLLRQLEESQKIPATPELLVLAEQVRMLLARYPADDPAVEALKQSEEYRSVAHLIEGPEPGLFGGFAQ